MAEQEAATAETPAVIPTPPERGSIEYATQRIAQGLIGATEPTEPESDEPSAPSHARDEQGRFTAAEEVSGEEPEAEEPEVAEPSSDGEPDTQETEGQPELPSTIEELAAAFERDPEWVSNIRAKAKIDGEEVEVTLAEALAGYQRTQDYTRKTTELSEQRAEFERAIQEAEAELSQRARNLAALTDTLQKQWQGRPPDPALLEKNPQAYIRQKETFEARQRALAAALHQRQQTTQAEQQKQQEAFQRHLEAERQKMVKNWPELADANSPVVGQVKTYLKDRGFSEQEIGQIYDHRMLGVLMDAIKANGVAQAAPAKKLQKPKPSRTVKASPPTGEGGKADKLAAARRNHRRDPKSTDAAAARIRAILG